jgi:uncharacterized membrane protein
MGRALKPWLTSVALFALACAPGWVGLYGGRGIGDMYLFRMYAHRMERGLWPYHGFFFDWPPGTVPPVLAPAVLPGPYYVAFHVLAFLYGALMLWAVAATLALLGARSSRIYAGTAVAAVAPFALGAITIDSTDLWPAMFLALGLAALVAGRDRLGFGLIGFAVVAKVYAIVVLPLALYRVWRREGRAEALRCLAVAAAVIVVVALPFAVVGPTGLGFTIKSQLVRGLQMESLGASVLMALDHLGVYSAHVVVGQPYSLDVGGGVAKAVGFLSTLLTVAAILWVYDRYRRGGDDAQRFVNACVAAVCAYVVFNKVLSPQYIVWLIPLVPLVSGTAGVVASALLLAAAGVTQTWFPSRFWHLVAVSPVSWFALLRNLLLVGVFVAVAYSTRDQVEPSQAEQLRRK